MDKVDSVCKVCGDKASGKHYGVPSCDGCRGFFKRSIRRGLAYHCKEAGACVVDVSRRNQCQACRFKKCLAVNMKREAVQHERAPRTSLPTHQSCPTRRYPFGASAPLTSPAPSMDLVGYHHLLYPQPQLPFPLGIKSPMSLGFFNNYCANFSPTLLTHDACSLLRLPARASSVSAEQKFMDEIPRSTSVAENEVTSSEEASQTPTEDCKPRASISQSLLELPLIASGPDSVYECAAKILFLTVKWARSIPSFLQLSLHDQTLLIEESWSDLFVISAGEWVLPIYKEYLLRDMDDAAKRSVLEKEIHRLQEAISRFVAMRLDHTENSCLKALTLFKPETHDLDQRSHIEFLQEQAHAMLQEHCARPDTPKTRFGRLLLLLPTVHTLSKDNLEELLFRKTIGNISIERVLSDMLRSNPG